MRVNKRLLSDFLIKWIALLLALSQLLPPLPPIAMSVITFFFFLMWLNSDVFLVFFNFREYSRRVV